MAGRLDGKVAIITGGVSGMGYEAVHHFVREGAKVIIADIQPEKGAAMEKKLGDSVRYAQCNIMEEEDIKGAIDLAVKTYGGLDVMYHNAGAVGSTETIENMCVKGWDDTFSLLLTSTMLCIRHSIEPMKKRGKGSIILTSSASCVALGGSGTFAYTVAKGAVITTGKYAALELAKYLIRVNTIVPGAYPTSIWSGHLGEGAETGDAMQRELSNQFSRMQALPIMGDVKNIAYAATYLASDESEFVTGVALPVDGGLTLHRNAAASKAGQLEAVNTAKASLQ